MQTRKFKSSLMFSMRKNKLNKVEVFICLKNVFRRLDNEIREKTMENSDLVKKLADACDSKSNQFESRVSSETFKNPSLKGISFLLLVNRVRLTALLNEIVFVAYQAGNHCSLQDLIDQISKIRAESKNAILKHKNSLKVMDS
jgi:hypothetical protein